MSLVEDHKIPNVFMTLSFLSRLNGKLVSRCSSGTLLSNSELLAHYLLRVNPPRFNISINCRCTFWACRTESRTIVVFLLMWFWMHNPVWVNSATSGQTHTPMNWTIGEIAPFFLSFYSHHYEFYQLEARS